jgi:beta-lactamase class A
MMKLVTHQLPVGTLTREIHLVNKNGDDTIHGRVVGQFDKLFFVAGGIPDFDGNILHDRGFCSAEKSQSDNMPQRLMKYKWVIDFLRRFPVNSRVRFLLLVLAASLVTCFDPGKLHSADQKTSPPSNKQEVLWQKLQATIGQIDKKLDGVLGVAIQDLVSGQKWSLNGDEIFPQASSIKIAVLAELFRQEQEGIPGNAKLLDAYVVRESDLVPDSDVLLGLTPGLSRVVNRDLASFMVSVSDNSATNILIDRIGMNNVNKLLDKLGLKKTRLQRKMMDLKAAQQGRENISTPLEMMALLEALYRGKVLNKAMTEDYFKVLSTHKDSALMRGLPDGAKAATKPGALEGVRNDSGIVFAKNRPFILCVMTTYLRDEKAGERAISDIAAAAYRHFDRLGRASEYGRVISPYNSAEEAK